jgi:hypothetical protein
MQTRIVAYAAVSVPLLLAAFVAGIVFERYRAQSLSVEGLVPAQTAAASKAQQELAPQNRSREQQIIAAMQAIESAWRTAIEGEDLFAVRHSETCYSARFIRRGAKVGAEVKKGDTPPDLFAGIIRVSGMTATTGKFACFKSFKAALAASKRSSEDLEHVDAIFSYAIEGNAIRLDHAKSNPEWFGRVLMYNLTDNPPSWSAVGTQPIKTK